nr:PREDICTED: D-beta-hydroxybutyrate dehydrogenase, mitochondrial-like isoform X2 [Latimeria chalumnae]XP_014354405.1 PREDICTED: D-beta-hydroxybutyrate dehydrogenase, mitochondrial-like isoform X2 [Latimeria chalumnae]|eukprot:XP_014354404.1 PREDICTED: D-beta-hydroxybutyrate dehydrogenase, mitochondrial-like isoform X2 [Latimeria chalumnae]
MHAASTVFSSLLLAAAFYLHGLALATCLGSLLSLLWLRRKEPTGLLGPRDRAVLVTGCDSGFGYLLARRLDQLGCRVFATCLFPEGDGARRLRQLCSGRLRIVKCDVTRDEDVRELQKVVTEHTAETGLWGLVNNAGITAWGEVEWNHIQSYQRVADVNLFGSIRTTLAFIPLVRKSKGRMVFISSITAAIPTQCNSMYSITKRGLEAFCDCLRIEMKKFGIEHSTMHHRARHEFSHSKRKY